MTTDLGNLLRDLPTPEAGPGLRERIVASRAAGARVMLLLADAVPQRRFAFSYAAAIAAAVVLVVGFASGLLRRSGSSDEVPADAGGMLFWPAEAVAQEPGGQRYTASYGPAQLDLGRFGPGRWVYQTRVIIDGFVTDTVTADTLTVAADEHRGHPAWRVTNRWGNRYFAARDTLLLERDGLRPLRRAGVEGRTPHPGSRGRAFDFPADVPFGPVLLMPVEPGYVGSRLYPFMRAALGMLDYLYLKPVLRTLPLRDGWRGSVYVSWSWRGAASSDPIPLDIRVLGREPQTVPAGTFECWKVELRVPSNKATTIAWISTDHHWVVRLSERLRDGALEQVLVSATPPAP